MRPEAFRRFAARHHRGDEARGQACCDSFPGMSEAGYIARAIVFALEQPARMAVARMVVVSAHKV